METNNYNKVIEWTKGYFKSFDNHDEDFYDRYIDDNVLLQAGNYEPTKGIETLKTVFESIHEPLETITHNLQGIYIVDKDTVFDYVISLDISIDYKLKNGKQLTIPAATILKVKDFKVVEHKGFMDASPLSIALTEN